jgi:ankyrin repeat protein
MRREEFDMDTNSDIMYELLQKYNEKDQVNMRCGVSGRTALHLAVEVHNVGAVARLIGRGADQEAKDDAGETPGELARKLGGREEILELLEA